MTLYSIKSANKLPIFSGSTYTGVDYTYIFIDKYVSNVLSVRISPNVFSEQVKAFKPRDIDLMAILTYVELFLR